MAAPPPAETEPKATVGHGTARVHTLAATYDFYHFEALTALRLRTSLRAFEVLTATLSLAGLAAAVGVSAGFFGLLRALFADQPGAVHGLTVLFCVANLYAAAGYVFREALSHRRFAVANSPNVGFFRALDLPARDVFVVYCGLRATMFYLALALINVVFAVVFGLSPALTAAVLLVPSSMCVITLAVAARSALRRATPRPIPAPAALALGALCFGIGLITARYLIGPVRDAGLATSFSQEQADRLVVWTGGAAAVAGLLFAVRLAADLRRLTVDSFAIQEAVSARTGAGAGADRLAALHPVAAVLHRELIGSSVYPLVRRVLAVLFAALAGCLGVLLSGAEILPLERVPDRAPTIAYALVLVTALGMTELLLRAIGPTTFAPHFRFAWEAGLSQWGIAVTAAVCYLIPVAAVGAGAALLLAAFAGPAVTPGGPLSVAVAVTAASLVAEAVTAPPRNVDGTPMPNTVGALVALILAVPVMIPLSFDSALGHALAAAYGICLLGGAIVCMERRIMTLPSTSST